MWRLPAPLWVVFSQLTSLQVMCPGSQLLWRLALEGTPWETVSTGTQTVKTRSVETRTEPQLEVIRSVETRTDRTHG